MKKPRRVGKRMVAGSLEELRRGGREALRGDVGCGDYRVSLNRSRIVTCTLYVHHENEDSSRGRRNGKCVVT